MKSKKWLIAAGVFGMVLTGSAGVYAGTQLETIKAYLNHGLAIEVNGRNLHRQVTRAKSLRQLHIKAVHISPFVRLPMR